MAVDVLHDDLMPDLMGMMRELARFKRMRIRVGVLGKDDSDLVRIAAVHEYGMEITPKTAKNLAIPIHKDAKGKSPRDFPGMVFIELPETGDLYGCLPRRNQSDWEDTDNLKFMFILLKSVRIPERSFIRGSYDTGQKTIDMACEEAVRGIIKQGWDAQKAADHVGRNALQMTQDYFNTQLGPPKSKLTQITSTQEQPLFDTGRLYGAITYMVEEG